MKKGKGNELQISRHKVNVTGHKVRRGNVVNNIGMTLYGVRWLCNFVKYTNVE